MNEHTDARGELVFEQACHMGLEGIVLSPRMVADALAKVRGRTVGLARVPRVSPDEGSRPAPSRPYDSKKERTRTQQIGRAAEGVGERSLTRGITNTHLKHREQPI
jgi:hypothetical protein